MKYDVPNDDFSVLEQYKQETDAFISATIQRYEESE